MSTFLFRDGTLNLPYDMASSLKMEDLKTALNHEVDILGLQEIQNEASLKVVKKFLRRHPFWGVRWGGECPILFKRTKFKVHSHKVYETDPGKAGVNPRRVINSIYVTHRKSEKSFTYDNHHAEHRYTQNHQDEPDFDYRVAAAKRGLDNLYEGSADRIGGDLNAPRNNRERAWYPYSFGEKWNLKNNGLDYIGWWASLWNVRNVQVIPVNSDHNLLLVDVWD